MCAKNCNDMTKVNRVMIEVCRHLGTPTKMFPDQNLHSHFLDNQTVPQHATKMHSGPNFCADRAIGKEA